ncbi:interferon-induced 6-16 family protein [Rhizoctonia solani]|uniref:Interferon-induced 6-16 family protein n=1 Tax=Rhizoctonia solani TaxID=456999 RepID=A0A8H8P6H5_9AGAM|nr:interferon-induced 6-16 family protein [Rhizoctonia solani]QRW26045.1 interferon-induced 6-16 family protein [Rhizoctonia solani]
MADIMDLFPNGMTPKTEMVGFYMTVVYVLLIGFCVLLITARNTETKETLVNGVGLRLVVVNWLMTAWAALWALQLFIPSTIVLGIVALLLGWIMFSLVWYTPGGPLTRPFDSLFIHSPLKLWFLITLTLDFPLSLFIALEWNYPYTRPDMYARKQWEAFAFIVSMHAAGVLWVFFRQDLTITIGGLWIVLSILLRRPKGAPVFAALIIFAVLYPLTYISTMAWKRLRRHEENQGRIALPPDEEESVEGNHYPNGNGTQEDAATIYTHLLINFTDHATLALAAFVIELIPIVEAHSGGATRDVSHTAINKALVLDGTKESEQATSHILDDHYEIQSGRVEDQKALKVADKGIETGNNAEGVSVPGNGAKTTDSRAVEAAEESVEIGSQSVRRTHESFQRISLHPNERDDSYPNTFEDFGRFILACAEKDCRNDLFMNEATRWIVQAVKDIGFGSKGPIKNSFASTVQRIISPVKSGSLFSKLQSAAMGGAAIAEIKTLIRAVMRSSSELDSSIIAFGAASNSYMNNTQEWENGIPTATGCMPKWAEFENEGCILYGYRRKFARLMGLAKNDDWRSMCESTPAIIDGKNYSHPSHCDDKGVWGIYGVFDLMDKDWSSFVMRENDDFRAETPRSIKDDIIDTLKNLPNFSSLLSGLAGDRKAEALKVAAQSVEEILGRVPSRCTQQLFSYGYCPRLRAQKDCKKNYFMEETMRWVRQALNDAGVVIYENPKATAALIIGISVLVANIMSGGMLIPAALQAIGFGAKGPIKDTIATVMQRATNPIKIGSMFSKLQSAAMGGATMGELQRIANAAVTGLVGVSTIKLMGAGIKPLGQSTDFDPREWRTWESESKVDSLAKSSSGLAQLWGTPSFGGCVAYGYREIRAPLWFVPEGKDPLSICVRTPASFDGIGYKTPLGCVDEGPKKGVVGMWYVPTNETRCMPQWSTFEDEWPRRDVCFMAEELMGLKSNDDWNGMCESTSANIGNKHYEPSYCEDKGLRGIYGVFVDIVDKQCECSCVRI